ncbi:MAG TPA: hypothetical protein VFW66_04020 [Gemmatimonadales bacterium]|nr:hypothetical protein [Gemmatimonadales bacterium]
MHPLAGRLAVGVLLLALGVTRGAGAARAQIPTVSVGGLAYAQYAYQFHGDSVTGSHLNAFDITRAYITITARFPLGVGARITPDIYRSTDGSLAYRLKYAYATWTPGPSPLTLELGQIHTPWLDWEEALWDYRMQGTMALERFRGPSGSYLSSSDLGFGVDGKFASERVSFELGAYNGETYKSSEGDQHKDVSGRLSVRLLESDDSSRMGGLRVTGYGQIGEPTGGGRRNRYIAMLSYKSRLFTLAGEYARTRDRLDNLPPASGTPVPTTDADIWSFFGVFHIPHTRAALIGRVDVQKPDISVANNRQTRFIAGASYQLNQNLRVLADVDDLSFESRVYPNAIESTRTQGLFQMQFAF